MSSLRDFDIGPDGVRKARGPLTNRQWLLDLADKFRGTVATTFLAAVERVHSQMTIDRIVTAFERGNPGAAMLDLALPESFANALRGISLPPRQPAFMTTLTELYRVAGVQGVEQLPTHAGLRMRFDLLNPRAVDWLRRYDLGLIREITEPTVDAVRNIMLRSFDEGIAPRKAAREIREAVGLTARMESIVQRRRAELEADGRPADQVERMTEAYRRKWLRYRSENIARTETIRASAEGSLEQERQMRDAGILGSDAKRMWSVTRDDRLCQFCAAIPGLNAKGRSLDEPFLTPDGGNVMTPPAHPSCRCVIQIVSGFAGATGLIRPQS